MTKNTTWEERWQEQWFSGFSNGNKAYESHLNFIAHEISEAKRQTREEWIKISCGHIKDAEKACKRLSPEKQVFFMEGFRFARNNLQKEKGRKDIRQAILGVNQPKQ